MQRHRAAGGHRGDDGILHVVLVVQVVIGLAECDRRAGVVGGCQGMRVEDDQSRDELADARDRAGDARPDREVDAVGAEVVLAARDGDRGGALGRHRDGDRGAGVGSREFARRRDRGGQRRVQRPRDVAGRAAAEEQHDGRRDRPADPRATARGCGGRRVVEWLLGGASGGHGARAARGRAVVALAVVALAVVALAVVASDQRREVAEAIGPIHPVRRWRGRHQPPNSALVTIGV